MRRILAIVVALPLGACSSFGSINFNGPSLDPSKIYLNATDIVSVSQRETHRYACYEPPMLCVQRGIGFDCRCP